MFSQSISNVLLLIDLLTPQFNIIYIMFIIPEYLRKSISVVDAA